MVTLEAGKTSELSPLVRRIVAPNPSAMTGAGTNTYLVGREEVAVIDPGPDDPDHVAAILAAGGGRIRWILVTHTHPDHSPGAAPLARATGAEQWGARPPDDQFQDPTFEPDHELRDGQTLPTAEFSLRAVHTPGHVGNHYCFLLEQEGMLMTGDHIMNGSTVVIIPPGGDMKDYIESLQKLTSLPLVHLAPGHGELMPEPLAVVQWIVNHRLQREAKVVSALGDSGGGTLDQLIPLVYDDVNPTLYGMAKFSLWAHLIKLEREQRAGSAGDKWFPR